MSPSRWSTIPHVAMPIRWICWALSFSWAPCDMTVWPRTASPTCRMTPVLVPPVMIHAPVVLAAWWTRDRNVIKDVAIRSAVSKSEDQVTCFFQNYHDNFIVRNLQKVGRIEEDTLHFLCSIPHAAMHFACPSCLQLKRDRNYVQSESAAEQIIQFPDLTRSTGWTPVLHHLAALILLKNVWCNLVYVSLYLHRA